MISRPKRPSARAKSSAPQSAKALSAPKAIPPRGERAAADPIDQKVITSSFPLAPVLRRQAPGGTYRELASSRDPRWSR